MMRGEQELRTLVATLEEIVNTVAADGAPEEKLVELGERHMAASAVLRRLFDEEPRLSESEQANLAPLMVEAGRLNALASSNTSREHDRVGVEIDKVRRATDLVRRRRGETLGRSCDLSG